MMRKFTILAMLVATGVTVALVIAGKGNTAELKCGTEPTRLTNTSAACRGGNW